MVQGSWRCVVALFSIVWFAAPGAAQKAATDDALRLVAAKELVKVSQVAKDFETAIPQLLSKISNMLVARFPQKKSLIIDVFAKLPAKSGERNKILIEDLTRLYAKGLTAAEMNEIIGLFKSQAPGAEVAASAALLDAKLMGKFQKIAQAFQIKLIKQFVKEATVEISKRTKKE